MPIYLTEKDYFDNIRSKKEISLLDLIDLEDFDSRTGKLERLESKLNNLCNIVCVFLESVPEGKGIIKKYVEYSCVNGISYEDKTDDNTSRS